MLRSLLLELMHEGAVTVQTPETASTGATGLALQTTVHPDGNVIISVPGDHPAAPEAVATHLAAVARAVQRLRREAGLVTAAVKAGGCGVLIIRYGAAAWAGLGTLLPLVEQGATSLGLDHFRHVYYALALMGLTEAVRLYGRWQIRSWLRKYGFG